MLGDIILHMCNINDFCPFTVLRTRKIKILRKWKKRSGDITILHKCTKNHDHMLHCSWDTTHDGCNFYFSFWAIFCPFTPPSSNNPKNQNFNKMKKMPGDIIILQCVPKIMITWCTIPEIWSSMDGQKSDIKRWVSHLKTLIWPLS